MYNHNATLDGTSVIYAHEFHKVEQTGTSTITENIDNAIVASGGISQADLTSALSPLETKDLAYGNTLSTHIQLLVDYNNTINSNITAFNINKTNIATNSRYNKHKNKFIS